MVKLNALGGKQKQRARKHNKAIIAYEKSIKLSPNNAVAFNSGNAYQDQGKVEKAMRPLQSLKY